MTGRRRAGGAGRAGLALFAALWLALSLAGCAPGAAGTPSSAASAAAPSTSGAAPAPSRPAHDPTSGLPTIALADLPPEGQATLALIIAGGPYPYSQDGSVFQNREGILPDQPSGYYREYTVPTPGSPDRGARRIVVGREGERYYTADHYATFERIWP
ncbi:MAG: ribonuclease domain-containing protein [Chloroflexota bacterium]